jgi:hypothetical protein
VVTATVVAATTACTCVNVTGTGTVIVGPVTGTLTANPACYALNFPPLPWSFAHATFSVSGAPPGAVVSFHVGGAANPVVCTAQASPTGIASCTANLNITQLLSPTYTATTTPISGGTLTATSSLSPCIG